MARFIPEPRKIRLEPATKYPLSIQKLRIIWGSDAAVRREYRRLQAAVDKRLKRAEAAGYGRTAYAREMRRVKRISKLESMEDVARALNTASRILRDKRYTLQGIRKGQESGVRKLEEQGAILPSEKPRSITRAELDTLFEAARKRGFLQQYGSDEVADLYKTRQESGKPTDYSLQQWQGPLSAIQRKLDAVNI